MSANELMLALRAGFVAEVIAYLLANNCPESAKVIAFEYGKPELLPLAVVLPKCPELQLVPMQKTGIWQS